jgi:hypothetical protein
VKIFRSGRFSDFLLPILHDTIPLSLIFKCIFPRTLLTDLIARMNSDDKFIVTIGFVFLAKFAFLRQSLDVVVARVRCLFVRAHFVRLVCLSFVVMLCFYGYCVLV